MAASDTDSAQIGIRYRRFALNSETDLVFRSSIQ